MPAAYERQIECNDVTYARFIARALLQICPKNTRINIRENEPVKSKPIRGPSDVTTFSLIQSTAAKYDRRWVDVEVRIGWLSGYDVQITQSDTDPKFVRVELERMSKLEEVWTALVLAAAAVAFVVQTIWSFRLTDLIPGHLLERAAVAVFWAVIYITGILMLLMSGRILGSGLARIAGVRFDFNDLDRIGQLLAMRTDQLPPRSDDPEINPVEAIRSALNGLEAPKA